MAPQSEIIRLTEAIPQRTGFISYSTANDVPVPSANGLTITFDLYAYGGTGADGISFFLVDGQVPITTPGGFGGSLGYAPYVTGGASDSPGLAGGYLGIGFDAFGSFSTSSEGRSNFPNGAPAPGLQPDAVVVRGSQATNYAYLAGTQLLGSLDNPGPAATQANSKRNAKIDLSAAGLLSVSVDLNQDGDFLDVGETPIQNLNVVSAGNGAVPASFRFGFAAATGAQTNIHEVGNFNVTTSAGAPIPGIFGGRFIVDDRDNPTPVDTPVTGGSGNDSIQTGGGNDTVTGGGGNDLLVGGGGTDTVTGGTGADRFYFRGATKAAALRESTFRALDRIGDFRFTEGDKFGLDFDNNLATIERPKGLFNAGRERGSLLQATRSAYADKNGRKRGNQRLRADEAVVFRLGARTFLSVNDSQARFSQANDLLVDVTGIQFKSGDLRKGALAVTDYFV
jgi:serralysin